MKTTMIKSATLSLATLGLACNLHAQAVGFGLSFNSAGLNSIGFSYAGGNFGVGVGFNTYSTAYYPYYPYSYPYCDTYYTWPTYSTFYWGPTWGCAYPWYSSWYYPGWYSCAHPYYYGCSSYYGYYNGCNPHYSGYYYAQPHNAGAYHGTYAHAGGSGYYGSGNHNAPLTARPPSGIAAPISQASMPGARTVGGSTPYHRVFPSATWDQSRPATQIHASNSGMIAGRPLVSNPSKGVTAAPGSQRIFGAPAYAANAPARPASTFAAYQPGRVGGWNAAGSHTAYSGTAATPRPMTSSPGLAANHYAPAWYRPDATASRTPTRTGSFNSRPAPAPNRGNQVFGGVPRSANGHVAQPAVSRPSGSVARALPATHGGFTGGQMAQARSVGGMGGGHAIGGFRH